MNKIGVAILGSTGSIGTQALEVIEAHPDRFDLRVLTAHSNADLLIAQARKFLPQCVVIVDGAQKQKVANALAQEDVVVYTGEQALDEVVALDSVQVVLTSTVGYSGLLPTIAAIKAGKNIALANKETLVVAGELITKLVKQYGVKILPVDSEHSALFQCLVGEEQNAIEKIVLTASGGPFRGKSSDFLKTVQPQQALKHPNWTMGAKITIDSATLMNKGLEVIEAKWLFDLQPEQIDVVVHPQSIIHSLVQFTDGSMKAQMGLPDMKLPIQYAFGFPQRWRNDFPRFDFAQYPSLTFEAPNSNDFINLPLAFESLRRGGNIPCALNAANEVTVEAFLQGRIGFLDIGLINERIVESTSFDARAELEVYIQTNAEARKKAQEWIEK